MIWSFRKQSMRFCMKFLNRDNNDSGKNYNSNECKLTVLQDYIIVEFLKI